MNVSSWGRVTAVIMRFLTSLALSGALAFPLSAPATAFELFGIQFFGGDEEDVEAVIADPRTYEITFETSADGALDTALRNASNLWTDRDQPASGVPGLLAKARGDYSRLLAALYNEGYYGGAISITVAGREASAIPPDAELPDPVAITVTVNPGRQFVFGTLRVGNAAPANVAADDAVPPLASTGFATGQVARAGVIAQAETLLVQAWRQLGYPKADIATREVVADHPSGTLEVTLTVDPGAHAVIGPVATSGTQNMDPDFVVRQTGLVPGEEYDPDDIALARARLARLDVFRSLRIEAADAVRADGVLPYTIFVQEQKLRRFGIGATLSSVDGLGLEGYWLHRNLFGQAERLRLDAKVSGIGFPVETAEFDYAFGGTFTKPGIWTPDTDLVAAISAERSVLPLYEETSVAGRVGLEHLFTGEITAEGGFSAEYAYFEDDTYGAREFTTAGLYGAATFDSRDSTLEPTEGFYLSASVDPLYEFTYGNAIVGATLEGRTYFSLDADDNYILAARVKAGAIVGPDVSEIPPSMLFFAGGGGSVRGYGYRSIGVETDDGVTGGRYLLEGSLEARARFGDSFGGVAFLDGGFVADDAFPTFDDLRLGAGVGIRYYTALGPLRLDLAVPLNKTEDDPDYALYVGIGQAF
ncbi:autotransporter assembly complex protein TamA [Pelagibacterium xiamenense]|uniref:autotransporter assembly complex protein TamA n=1 Tax=Pelagibacterium xiamenense TaxID=2901140 RepID=UPI001E539A2C|nr:autotransporter assembly complex family protein [Pelagibacterium xiamenense]MCD7058609.1 autotransporter assembly complex protein TamA [Pelagibacterium xiamenense]